MAATVTWDELRQLAGFRAKNGRAISLYVNLDPRIAPTAGDAATRINSLLDDGEKAGSNLARALSHGEREALKADLDRIRQYLETDFDRDGAHGVALFAAGADGVWRPLRLPAPVPDRISVAEDFALAPLVPLVGHRSGVLVAFVSRERGNIYRLEDGRLEEIVDRTEDTPGRHDQGGWSQARYERHIENIAQQHMRGVAGELDRLVRRNHNARVVIVANEEIRSDVAAGLSQETQAALVGWASAEAHSGPAELLDVVDPILENAEADHEASLLERWREGLARQGRGTAGWPDTLEAASDARVETLVFEDGAQREAWQCPECGRAAAREGRCPLDGSTLQQRDDGLGVAVQRTLLHGGTACVLRHHLELGDDAEGIGALLRF